MQAADEAELVDLQAAGVVAAEAVAEDSQPAGEAVVCLAVASLAAVPEAAGGAAEAVDVGAQVDAVAVAGSRTRP